MNVHPLVVSVVTVMFAGHVIAGSCVSCTVTVNEHVDVLFDASVAVQLTVVAPTGKVEPETGEQLTVVPGQLSEVVGAA